MEMMTRILRTTALAILLILPMHNIVDAEMVVSHKNVRLVHYNVREFFEGYIFFVRKFNMPETWIPQWESKQKTILHRIYRFKTDEGVRMGFWETYDNEISKIEIEGSTVEYISRYTAFILLLLNVDEDEIKDLFATMKANENPSTEVIGNDVEAICKGCVYSKVEQRYVHVNMYVIKKDMTDQIKFVIYATVAK